MPINVVYLAGNTLGLFEHEPLNIFSSMDTIIYEKPKNDWKNPIFNVEPDKLKLRVEYYGQSAMNGKILTMYEIVFKDHWEQYPSWADKSDWDCQEDDQTE